MWKWLKKQSSSVKAMLLIGLIALAGIIIRWEYVSSQAAESVKSRFRREQPEGITAPTQPADTVIQGTDSLIMEGYEDTDN